MAASDRIRTRLSVRGAVQGVGFRPFVYRLATDMGLSGSVINTPRGVVIDIEGPPVRVLSFPERLRSELPAVARITDLESETLEPLGCNGFRIEHSEVEGVRTAQLLPDMATCPDCLAEVFDPSDRRYRYPFTNCTHCGPRFSIIKSLPYDRPNTTMSGFSMCPACLEEYRNPLDR
ncbi:MAG TPA: acylphosphatase, partial [Armatimonadota bacterium]|nr:acylphosphatase [Armatimonadota bacterium]